MAECPEYLKQIIKNNFSKSGIQYAFIEKLKLSFEQKEECRNFFDKENIFRIFFRKGEIIFELY